MSQNDALICVISHFKNNKKFMKNVIGFHTVFSKSDLWSHGSPDSSVRDAAIKADCDLLLLHIDQLVKECSINRVLCNTVNPVPFSIGKFMLGETYEFDDRDARRILSIIKNDLDVFYKDRTPIQKIRSFFDN